MTTKKDEIQLLLHGIDTLQCAYFLHSPERLGIDFQELAEQKEGIRQSKSKAPFPLQLGNSEFLLHPYGSSSGYPFIISNECFKIEMGEFNRGLFAGGVTGLDYLRLQGNCRPHQRPHELKRDLSESPKSL